MNGVEPCAWLKITLEKIAAGHPQSRIHELPALELRPRLKLKNPGGALAYKRAGGGMDFAVR